MCKLKFVCSIHSKGYIHNMGKEQILRDYRRSQIYPNRFIANSLVEWNNTMISRAACTFHDFLEDFEAQASDITEGSEAFESHQAFRLNPRQASSAEIEQSHHSLCSGAAFLQVKVQEGEASVVERSLHLDAGQEIALKRRGTQSKMQDNSPPDLVDDELKILKRFGS